MIKFSLADATSEAIPVAPSSMSLNDLDEPRRSPGLSVDIEEGTISAESRESALSSSGEG